MTELLGKPVGDSINESLKGTIADLEGKGIVPTLAVVRVGAREDDLAYERGIKKKFSDMNCQVTVVELPEDVSQEDLDETVKALDNDSEIHGILLFRPFNG